MVKNLLWAGLVLVSLGVVSLAVGQDVDLTACQDSISTNCTKCHSTKKICRELGEADANWPEIIKDMGKRGKLSQEIQDAVLKCLTQTADPSQFVCNK